MAYLCVLLALAVMTVKGYCGKKTGNCMKGKGDAFLFSLVRMLLCILIGLIPLALDRAWGDLTPDGGMMAICLLAGASNAAFLVGWILAVEKNAMVTVDVTLTIGSILPAILCAILFDEVIRLPKLLGFALIILASAILAGYNKSVKGKPGAIDIFFLALAAVGEGMVSFSQQLYKQYYSGAEGAIGDRVYPMSVYHFYTYVFAGALLLLFFLVYEGIGYVRAPKDRKPRPIGRLAVLREPIVYIAVMAVCLFLANYFQTLATSTYGMPSVILYPLIKGACLIVVSFTAMIFFGERITKRSILGSAIAIVGIVVMNIF